VITYKKYLCYKFPTGLQPLKTNIPNGFCCNFATESLIKKLFSSDKKRKKIFLNFLQKGFIGLIIYNHQANKCAAYGWATCPGTEYPLHLPFKKDNVDSYWIFYCRTFEEYRNQGLYKNVLSSLVNYIREKDPLSEIFIDTEIDNLPSRKAIKKVGFVPSGIIYVKSIALLKIFMYNYGYLDTNAEHPPIEFS